MTTQHFTRAMTVRIPESLVERLQIYCRKQSEQQLTFVSLSRCIALLLEEHLSRAVVRPRPPRFTDEAVSSMTVRIPESLMPALHRWCLAATPERKSYSRGIAILLDEHLPPAAPRARSKAPARRRPRTHRSAA